MSAPAPKADFKLVLLAVNPAKVQGVVAELAELFPIDQKTALGAVRNAPIVLVGGLTQQMAANLRSHLLRLSRLGAQLRLTSDPVGKLKQFRWPAPPPAALRPANLFTCPACGERFTVQRAQAATITPVTQPPAEATAPAPPQPAAEPAPATPPEPDEAAIPEAEPVQLSPAEDEVIPEAESVETEATEIPPVPPAAAPPPPPTPVSRDELAELTGFLDSILKDTPKGAAAAPGPQAPAPEAQAPAPPPPVARPEAPSQAPPPSAPPPVPRPIPPPPQAAPAAAGAEQPKTLVQVAPPRPKPTETRLPAAPAQVPPPAPVAVPEAAVTAESPTVPMPPPSGPPKPRPMEIKPQTQVFPKPTADAQTATLPRPVAVPRAAAPPPKPAPAPEPPAGARYDVSVAKVRAHEAGALVQLLVERAGMAPEEAQRLCERMVVMVCRGGSAAEADEWRKTLEKIGLKPRIRKH